MKELPEDIQAKITAYIEGQLPPDEAAALEVYLANTDQAVADLVIGMLADRHSVQSLPKVAAPHDLAARVMEQIERSSLLSGVEHEFVPHRPWWQSRGAIAAGLALVLGGFGFFVIDAIRRPAGPLHGDSVASKSGVAPDTVADARWAKEKDGSALRAAGAPGGAAGLDDAERFAERSGDLMDAAKDAKERAKAGDGGTLAKGGGPAALTMDLSRSTDDQIAVNKAIATAADPVSAGKDNGYLVEHSVREALSTVYAGEKRSVSGPPVMLTLLARRADDPERLVGMINGFVAADATLGVNGDNTLADMDRAGAAYDAGTGNPKTSNAAGRLTTNNTTGNLSVNNTGGNDTLVQSQSYRNSNTEYNGTFTPQAAPNQSANTATYVVGRDKAGQRQMRALASTGEAYHRVRLRPEQLERIATEFKVVSVARGQLGYVISPDRAEKKMMDAKLAEGAAGAELPAATPPVGKHVGGSASAAPVVTPSPAIPATEQARPRMAKGVAEDRPVAEASPATQPAIREPIRRQEVGYKDLVKTDEVQKAARPEKAEVQVKHGESAAQQVAQQVGGQADSGAWLDVIIAMEPEAATVAKPAASQAETLKLNNASK